MQKRFQPVVLGAHNATEGRDSSSEDSSDEREGFAEGQKDGGDRGKHEQHEIALHRAVGVLIRTQVVLSRNGAKRREWSIRCSSGPPGVLARDYSPRF